MHAALELEGIFKEFPAGLGSTRVRALHDVSLRVPAGEVVALLGPNGSGKSTALKLLAGLLRPSRGRARIMGQDSLAVASRSRIGYLPESPSFPEYMKGVEVVRFYAGLSGIPRREREDRARCVLEAVGLAGVQDRSVDTYSKGMRQRLGLAQAIVHDPEVLLWDEPTAGVDLQGMRDMLRLIQTLKAEGRTVIMATHPLTGLGEACDRMVILACGRLVLDIGAAQLPAQCGREEFSTEPLEPGLRAELVTWLAARGHTLEGGGPAGPALERFYLKLIKSSSREEAP
jgi:ABC-2 type transport system ATP-binding protein